MSDDYRSPITESDDFSSDLAAFQQVASAFQRLDHAARIRLLKTIATFFKLDIAVSTPRDSFTTRSAQASGQPAPPPTFSEVRAPSPKEFMLEKKPLTDVERVTCLAYYLTHFRETPHFKTVDLSKLNTEAAQVKLPNAAQAVDNATKAGLLAPAVKGAKQLSAHGELYVQRLPDRAAAREAVANSRPRRKSKRTSRMPVNQAAGNDSDE
jgi:hypothetical protein